MNWKKITTILVPITLIIWGIYDVVTITQGGVETSISRTIRDWNGKYPQFTYAAFYVFGHLFWPQPKKKTDKITSSS